MGNQLTFTGSGELDNGLNVSLSFVLDQNDEVMVLQNKVTQELHLTVTLSHYSKFRCFRNFNVPR